MARSFFDTSALVKHYHPESGATTVDRLIGEPGAELVISRLTLVETASVFAIKVRTGAFDAGGFALLHGLFAFDVARKGLSVINPELVP
ncbi:type II toxin-antitoxin system VapC family toxin [Aquisphaera insulae]|uniref:type II toxin-antitoxin system VapC family toxin n=1 Tax=Aquisphaera insulae TaxID=2712864 RepID=UPI0013E9A5C8|nr:type II toxin-antitoxin system VapC family toxin [Aquisphaera insulae]